MLTRSLSLPKDKSCLLLGPRQTGKSTWMRAQLPKSAWTVDLLEHDAFLRYAKDPSQFRIEAREKIQKGISTIFVDEIQKVPDLLDEIHGLIESTKARFLLTGSSARKLKRRGTNLLAGRAVMRRLHPLTMIEIGDALHLERVLRLGSLPLSVVQDEKDAIDFLTTYTQTYLREEIQSESLVRNLGGFARFLELAAAQSGDLLNYSSVGRDAALASRTVLEYFQILEDTLVGVRLEPYYKSPRARLVAHPKFYLFDTGVTNAINRRLTAPLGPIERGRLFEQWVVLECVRAIDYAQSEARLFFWRTNHGAEVDLLVEKHGKIQMAVEIKAKKTVVSADLTGLRSFAEQHPGIKSVVVSLVPEPFRIGNVAVLPYRRFFEEYEIEL